LRVEEVLAYIDARIAELRKLEEETKSALEALKSLEEDPELIVSLGSGVVVKAQWKKEVLMDVGSGIIIERKPEDVKERLENRIKNIEEEIKKLLNERNRIIEEVKKGGQ
jgi:prefoldin alpha subunit